MARVLLGWELGANRGHIERLLPIANRLIAGGHDVAMALQQIDCVGPERDPRIDLWQAPVWPRLLITNAQDISRNISTMGDILAQLGLDRPGCLAAMISGWDAIFTAWQPDVVVADYAPALLAAARGRVKSISVGDGFSSPPAHAQKFLNLNGMPSGYDEEQLLDTVDADLISVGRGALSGLPELFLADLNLIGNFAEIDPYRRSDHRHYCAPSVKIPLAGGEGGGGEEIFVYCLNRIGPTNPIWDGLIATRRQVRVHMIDPTHDHLNHFKKLGIIFEPKPVTVPLIAKRSCLAVSYGGNGFVSACLIAGLPHLMLPSDLEKHLTVDGVAALGLGYKGNIHKLTAAGLTKMLNTLAGDEALAARLKDAAPKFLERMQISMADEVITAIARFIA